MQSRRGSAPSIFGSPRLRNETLFVKSERELRPYVESFWVFESPIGLPESNIAAPNGCCKLTFAYGNSFVSIGDGKAMSRPPQSLNLVGSTDSRILLQSSPPGKIGCIGIEFRPHGTFLGHSDGETLNFRGDADVVSGKWARRIQEGLGSRQSVDQRVTFLRDQLIDLLRKNQRSVLWRMQERNNDIVAYCVQASNRLMAECEYGTSSQEPRPLEATRICSSTEIGCQGGHTGYESPGRTRTGFRRSLPGRFERKNGLGSSDERSLGRKMEIVVDSLNADLAASQ